MDELRRGQFLGLRFELYDRGEFAKGRPAWRVASSFFGKAPTAYWLSIWTPTRSLRVFPCTLAWSTGEA